MTKIGSPLVIDSYRLENGNTITLSELPTAFGYVVYSLDCWDEHDRSRWHVELTDKEKALKAYGEYKL